jgi:hypothetical protein
MAETILITPAEITGTTVLGGNVDISKFVVNVLFVQLTVIEPLIGTILYNKIVTDFENNALTGVYLTLFDKYITPILKYESVAEYVEVGNFLVENGGTFTHVADNRQITTKDDTQFLAGKYHALAQTFISRFEKWICHNNIPEYKLYQEEVNAQKLTVRSGWYFGQTPTTYNKHIIEAFKE